MPRQIILSNELISTLKSIDHRFSAILIDSHENKEQVVENSYIGFSKEEGMVSYLPAKRETSRSGKELSEKEKWSIGRQSVSIGKLVRAILQFKKVQYKESELEEFVNQYKYQQFDFHFTLVKGKDIVKWYKEKNYDERYSGSGSLFNSCMRGVSSDYLKIYRDNENISMLCLISKETNKLLGRAIVWDNAKIDGSDAVFLDRIYTVKPSFESAIKDYCKSKGWFYKTQQGAGNMAITNGHKTIENPDIRFFLNEKVDWEVGRKPYIDTLSFFGYVSVGDKTVPVLTSQDRTNFKYNFKGTDGNIYDNVRYDSRKDLLMRRMSEVELYLIKYDNGYAWVDDTDYENKYRDEFRYNIKLIKDNEELITIVGMKDKPRAKFRHYSEIISNNGNKIPQDLHVYLFDLFNDDSIFIVDKTYTYLHAQAQFKLNSIGAEHFKMVLEEAPETVRSFGMSLTKEQLNIILEVKPEIIFDLSIEEFLKIQGAFGDDVIIKYIEKYPDFHFIEGRIAIKVSKTKIEEINRWNGNKFTKTEVEHRYGKSKCFPADGDNIYIHVESYWFTFLPKGTTVRREIEINTFKQKIYNFFKGNKTNYIDGVVEEINGYYGSIYVRWNDGLFEGINAGSRTSKKLKVLERDLKENVYQYLKELGHRSLYTY